MTQYDSVLLAEMTWPEVQEELDSGVRTAIVAVGSIEQHGPHLPLRMDTLAGDEVSRRIADRLGDAFAAPTIRPGCSGHHMDFPGTITIPAETLMDTIRGYCQSLDSHGFEHIVLVPTHGGNFAPTNTVAPEVAREVDANVIALADLDEYMGLLNEGLQAADIDYDEPVSHAGATETSVVLAAEEDLVRTDEYEPGHEGPVSTARLLSDGFAAVTDNGVLGNPTHATAEAGEKMLELVAEEYADQIRAERDAV
ncbi:creatininase [Halobacteriales archaeon QH_10_65_19]|nr:MAG: creatininase [Halobacteriales archaeon QH_10_65_19]